MEQVFKFKPSVVICCLCFRLSLTFLHFALKPWALGIMFFSSGYRMLLRAGLRNEKKLCVPLLLCSGVLQKLWLRSDLLRDCEAHNLRCFEAELTMLSSAVYPLYPACSLLCIVHHPALCSEVLSTCWRQIMIISSNSCPVSHLF